MNIRSVITHYANIAIQRRDQACIIGGLVGMDQKSVLDRAIALSERSPISVDDLLTSWLRQIQAGQIPIEIKNARRP